MVTRMRLGRPFLPQLHAVETGPRGMVTRESEILGPRQMELASLVCLHSGAECGLSFRGWDRHGPLSTSTWRGLLPASLLFSALKPRALAWRLLLAPLHPLHLHVSTWEMAQRCVRHGKRHKGETTHRDRPPPPQAPPGKVRRAQPRLQRLLLLRPRAPVASTEGPRRQTLRLSRPFLSYVQR
ncbi:hypothetical protein VUR80DRAFT_6997 [Thermomyces stellatus]